jgi:RNA polymerase sigma factor (sigma-70 family)
LSVPHEDFGTHLAAIWVEKYATWVQIARWLVGNIEDARDIVQDAAYASLRAAPDVASEGAANAYMRATVRSKALRLVQQRKKWRWSSWLSASWLPLTSHERSATDKAIEVEQRLEDQRLLSIAERGLEQLPEELRTVVKLTFYCDPAMTLREISELLGISISGVRSRLERGIQAMRKLDDNLSRR